MVHSKALKGRKTGESQDDYDDEKYADELILKSDQVVV